MQEKQERLQQRLQPEIGEFRQRCRSLLLATRDLSGMPNASYAPFVFIDGCFYVLVSEVARHGQNLREHHQAALMLIEDESACRQLYARQRLSYDAMVRLVARDSAEWTQGISALRERHGVIVQDLALMADFGLFCLEPIQGLYVKGFGQAFVVGAEDSVSPVHLTRGHQPVQEPTQ